MYIYLCNNFPVLDRAERLRPDWNFFLWVFREAGVSRHNGGQIETLLPPLKPLGVHYCPKGLR